MTLDEFRKHTKDMRGDVEIMYHHASGYHPVNTFRVLDDNNLVLCRDAYWKIAGEEMGLGKPWEPSKDKMVYSIYRHSNEIETYIFQVKA